MRAVAVVAALALWVAASATAAAPAPWKLAGDAELALSDTGSALILGDRAEAEARLASAEEAVRGVLAGRPEALRSAQLALTDAERAVQRGDEPALSAARAAVWTTILRASLLEATSAAAQGDVARARSWLLVREFRPPTRFSRAAADATVALDELAAGAIRPAKAAATVRRDLLDTYDSRLRTALAGLQDADEQGFAATRAEMGALALGYWQIVAPAYRAAERRPRRAPGDRVLRAACGGLAERRERSQRRFPTSSTRSRRSAPLRSRRRRSCAGPASSTGSFGSCRSSTAAACRTAA